MLEPAVQLVLYTMTQWQMHLLYHWHPNRPRKLCWGLAVGILPAAQPFREPYSHRAFAGYACWTVIANCYLMHQLAYA